MRTEKNNYSNLQCCTLFNLFTFHFSLVLAFSHSITNHQYIAGRHCRDARSLQLDVALGFIVCRFVFDRDFVGRSIEARKGVHGLWMDHGERASLHVCR